MCSHNNSTSWCGKCFMPDETGEISPAEKVVVKMTKQKPKIRPKNKLQLKMDM